MNKFIQSFSNKKFRYGAFATLITVFVLAILVVVNMVFSQFDFKFDLTPTKKYSITDETKEVLGKLQEDITIYTLFKTGSEDKMFTEILGQYQKASPKIKVINKDPFIYKTFIDQYSKDGVAVANNSIIVESAKRHKIIDSSELVATTFDQNTFQEIPTSYEIEPKTTNAIVYVTQLETPSIYSITGHNEPDLPADFLSKLSDANFNYKKISLLTEEIPKDCKSLIIITPQHDYSKEDAAKILAYLEKGGRILISVDLQKEKFVNIAAILNVYGVDFNNLLTYEGDSQRFIQNNRFLLPVVNEHAVNKKLTALGYPVLLLDVQGISTLDLKKNSIKVEPLLTTSNKSFGKNNPESQSINKEAGDTDGPFNLAVAVTDEFSFGSKYLTSKLVVAGTTSMFSVDLDQAVSGANTEFLISSLNWLTDKSDADSVYIPSKAYEEAGTITMNGSQQLLILVFAMGILPAAIIVIGLIIWLRRRNK